LGISRETVRKYSLLPDGYVPIINKAPVENIVDPYLPHIAKMLEVCTRRILLFQQLLSTAELNSAFFLQKIRFRVQVYPPFFKLG